MGPLFSFAASALAIIAGKIAGVERSDLPAAETCGMRSAKGCSSDQTKMIHADCDRGDDHHARHIPTPQSQPRRLK
ncbi:MAG: hypothetical protein AAAB35_24445 [Phyllobacterium sp.]|uniref:hypothetical protein n=1 Tax=Phyllobacterium sp. TaxID=1871046 RepID=UPI0030F09F1D